MTENVLNFNVDMDEACPRCGKGGSINGGLCLDCARKNLEGIIDDNTIKTMLSAIETMLYQNSQKANDAWRGRKADKIKILNVSIAIGRDKDGVPECKIDFGYAEKIGTNFMIRQKALPGMK